MKKTKYGPEKNSGPKVRFYRNELYTPTTKISRVLAALASGLSLNKYEAAALLYDHNLKDTIYDIEKHYAIQIQRSRETFEAQMGKTQAVRYWLTAEQQKKASTFLRKKKRNVKT